VTGDATAAVATRPFALMGGLALAIFASDRLSKWLVVEAMGLAHRQTIEIWPGYLALRMAWNRGINFGLLASEAETARLALAGLALAVSVGVGWWARRRGDRLTLAAAGLVIGGALGNAWDRLQYGAVADFLNVSCCGIVNPFAFNVADVAIFAGALGLAFAPSPPAPTAPAA
jgi:signal peptidase II